MTDLGITEPVLKATHWVNGLVVVEKPNGKLLVCLNPRSFEQSH